MARIVVETQIHAPLARCFDLARDLDLHRRSMRHTSEEAVGGRTSGLIELGEEVTWRAKHFGLFHTHTARITEFERPRHFRDEMTKGRFEIFEHDHHFEQVGGGTRMTDVLEFRSPYGLLGRVVDFLILKRYLRRLLSMRSNVIRETAEADNKGPVTH